MRKWRVTSVIITGALALTACGASAGVSTTGARPGGEASGTTQPGGTATTSPRGSTSTTAPGGTETTQPGETGTTVPGGTTLDWGSCDQFDEVFVMTDMVGLDRD